MAEVDRADTLVAALEKSVGQGVRAVLLFGSRLVQTDPSAFSAYDLVAVVDDYSDFYRRLHASGAHHRSPRVLTALARVLAPNVISFDPGLPGGEIAKIMVFTQADFARALSAEAPDHFLRGRLVQSTRILMARDPAVARELEALLAAARRDVIRWAGPWLPERFTALDFARRMLEVSYAGEVRPEAGGRVAAVFEAQTAFLAEAYASVLRQAEADGAVVRVDGGVDGVSAAGEPTWRLATAPGGWDALGWRLYFIKSKARATSRWLKHTLTFDDWLTYIQRKVERRTGMRIELTPLERRLPLLVLWPKVFRVLRQLRADRKGRIA
jgi:hypothetical protein